MEITRDNLLSLIRAGLKRLALSMTGLEREAGVPRDTIRDFLRGKTQVLRADKLQKILRVLEPEPKVRVVGIVGERGAEIAFSETEDAGLGEVDCPKDYLPSDLAAVRIKGDTMLPVFHDGWFIYYARDNSKPIPAMTGGWQVPYGPAAKAGSKLFAEFIGKPCIVGLADGRVVLGTLKRSAGRGGFDLVNHNATDLRNIKPGWAAKIVLIQPE